MSESEQLLKDEASKPRTPKLSAEKALPQSGADTLVKIIKGYAVASNGGETQINYKDVASAAGLGPTLVSANNKFLLESQILTSPKYGYYLPSEGAVRFSREAAWDEQGAKAHLRKIAVTCWYGQVAVQNFTLRSTLTREDLKRALAIKSGATEGDSNALEFLGDFIIYTGLVVENENGSLSKGNLDDVPQAVPTAPINEVAQSALTAIKTTPIDQTATKVGPSLVVHVHLRSFDDLTPDNAEKLKNWIDALQNGSDSTEVHVENGG